MTSDLKDVKTFFSVLDQIESFVLENPMAEFVEFKEDLDHVRISYNFRNK